MLQEGVWSNIALIWATQEKTTQPVSEKAAVSKSMKELAGINV